MLYNVSLPETEIIITDFVNYLKYFLEYSRQDLFDSVNWASHAMKY